MEPIFLEPLYKHHVWGGDEISKKIKKCAPIQISESWEIADNKNGSTIIKNGEYKGMHLNDLICNKEIKTKVFGTKCKNIKKFPLLIKFIDAKDNLSVQVHPNNFYAKRLENDIGKTEMWYVIDCADDAKIICGLKGKSNINIKKLDETSISNNLNYVPIKKGDAVLIKSGTIHAIMGNTLICEIQQNSDITYRVYDWNRNDPQRPLHLEKASQVINKRNKGTIIKSSNKFNEREKISYCKFFHVDKLKVNGNFESTTNKKTFEAVNIISGSGSLICNNTEYEIVQGISFIIPAQLGKYTIRGNMEMIISYV